MTSRPGPASAPPVIQPSSGNAIIINTCQRLNPLLEAIRNVPKEFGDIVPDFEVGRTTGVLYLSLKYHRLHPEYIHQRIEKLGHRYNLRILLIVCDISEHQDPIRELTKTCLINNITVIVSWAIDEAAHYLTTFKQSEHKSPDIIKERVDKDYASVLRSALTSIKGINKTDVETLRSNCRSFAGISRASEQTLLDLPGLAQTKVRRIRDAFHRPFRSAAAATPSVAPWVQGQGQGQGLAAVAVAVAGAEAASSSMGAAAVRRDGGDGGGGGEGLEEGERVDASADADGATSSSSKRPRTPPPTVQALAAQPQPEPQQRPRPPRSPSPIWDIELDLNDDDDDATPLPATSGVSDSLTAPSEKKRKADDGGGGGDVFGKPDSILASE